MKAIWAVLTVLTVLVAAIPSPAQVDEALQAIDRGEHVRAVDILSAELATRPTPDAYFYLGIAYARMREYGKAEDVLNEGAGRYPEDVRFHNQLADVFLENNDRESARSELQKTLEADPDNLYASDLLAIIDMSEGEVQSALRAWNRTGRPVVGDILHNYYLAFGSWVVRDALAFRPAGVLRYGGWKTTESRLIETGNFANVGLEIEPTIVPYRYTAIVRTTAKTNSLTDLAFGLVRGLPVDTSYLDLWNIGKSGINFNGNYRWDTDRRRAEGRLRIPIPLPGLLHLELGNTWRAERWDLSPSIRSEFRPRARFDHRSNTLRLNVKQIPHYRVELGAGIEYRNRYSKGELPDLFTDGRNVARFSAEASFRFVDRRYQNRLRLEGFLARQSILGDVNFSGGIVELNNRVTLSKSSRTTFDWTVQAGTSRGKLPVEDYFALGLDAKPRHPLRGHTVGDHGRYGRGPMGTGFVLVNADIDRHLATLPFFDYLNIPFVDLKWELFFDGAKTFDRHRIFQQGKLLLDAGGGLRFETPANSFNIVYGRSLREGEGIVFAYYERRLW